MLMSDAITEEVIYIGRVGVKKSMRSLQPTERSEVAQESINRLSSACSLGCKPSITTHRNSRNSIESMLEEKPDLTHSGTKVQLCVTTSHLNIIDANTHETIFEHRMPDVSFASSGDDNFVAFVAKDSLQNRACFVLECGTSTGNVLKTIALGFRMRTFQILHNNKTNIGVHTSMLSTSSHETDLDPLVNSNDDSRNLADIRAALQKEPWYHGSYLSREESETRLKNDGDFLVRESMLEPGNFVLSAMHEGETLHLIFDSCEATNQVRTRDNVFDNISHLVSYHHEKCAPIMTMDDKAVFLRNGVRPTH